jgi:hypothetical protein
MLSFLVLFNVIKINQLLITNLKKFDSLAKILAPIEAAKAVWVGFRAKSNPLILIYVKPRVCVLPRKPINELN